MRRAITKNAPETTVDGDGASRIRASPCLPPFCHQGQIPKDSESDVEGTPGVCRMMAVVGSQTMLDDGRQGTSIAPEVTVKAVERAG